MKRAFKLWLLLLGWFGSPTNAFTVNQISIRVLMVPSKASTSSRTTTSTLEAPRKALRSVTDKQKQPWNLFSLGVLKFPHLRGIKTKVTRLLAAFVVAVLIWMQGIPSLSSDGGTSLTSRVAHAHSHASRVPVCIEFNGASLAARTGTDCNPFLGENTPSKPLIPVTLSSTSSTVDSASRAPITGGKLMAAGAVLLVGIPSAGILVSKKDSHSKVIHLVDPPLLNNSVAVIDLPPKSKRKGSKNIEELRAEQAEQLQEVIQSSPPALLHAKQEETLSANAVALDTSVATREDFLMLKTLFLAASVTTIALIVSHLQH